MLMRDEEGNFLLIVLAVLVGGGLKAAGVRLPIIDYPIGPIGIFDGRGPAMPDVQIRRPASMTSRRRRHAPRTCRGRCATCGRRPDRLRRRRRASAR